MAYRQWHFPQVILNGAGVSENTRDFLASQGVPRGMIELENRSSSTLENALLVQQLVSAMPGRKILMTSDYHMFRAQRAFRRGGRRSHPVSGA
ncbi:MAG: hypothetical protein DMG57_16960 [Acidobacteria bacterium]|nr:MAG: hypothetical protein DMG57_16960 [Acidobacteriota bacterium]